MRSISYILVFVAQLTLIYCNHTICSKLKKYILRKTKELGTEAKKKLQLFAANFNAKRHQHGGGGGNATALGGAAHEHRSLLDDPEDDELGGGGGANHMEMGEMGFGSKKTI